MFQESSRLLHQQVLLNSGCVCAVRRERQRQSRRLREDKKREREGKTARSAVGRCGAQPPRTIKNDTHRQQNGLKANLKEGLHEIVLLKRKVCECESIILCLLNIATMSLWEDMGDNTSEGSRGRRQERHVRCSSCPAVDSRL